MDMEGKLKASEERIECIIKKSKEKDQEMMKKHLAAQRSCDAAVAKRWDAYFEINVAERVGQEILREERAKAKGLDNEIRKIKARLAEERIETTTP